MPDFNHTGEPLGKSTSPDVNVSEAVNYYINYALSQRYQERLAATPRDYLGMSEIGDICSRRVYLKKLGITGPPLNGERLRALAMGHEFEDMTLRWLIDAGFVIHTRNSQGQQFEFVREDGRIKGHIDGAILNGPQVPQLRYPALFEGKALKAKWWNAIVRLGLKKAEPKYWGQLMQYMDASKVFNTLFSCLNKDTAQMYHIVVTIDLAEAQKYKDRGSNILGALDKQLPPARIGSRPEFHVCKQCEIAESCWSMPT